jgi:hypothetical protein
VQYSPEWWTVRCGHPTASAFDRIITAKTAKASAAQLAYACELAGDIACLTPNFFTERENRPKSYAMENGTNTEPEARRFYEMQRDTDVRQVGFILDDQDKFGCSPDGLVGEDGGLELKCPLLKTQAQYVIEGVLPDEYKPQVHSTLWITKRKWWDFLSYAPGLPPLLVRVEPDDYTEKLGKIAEEFWVTYMEVLRKLGLEPRKAVAA